MDRREGHYEGRYKEGWHVLVRSFWRCFYKVHYGFWVTICISSGMSTISGKRLTTLAGECALPFPTLYVGMWYMSIWTEFQV